MRLMGSFQTMTTQGRSGTTSSSPAGRSTSTGAVTVLTPPFSQGTARLDQSRCVATARGAGGLWHGDERGADLRLDDGGAVAHGPPPLVVVHAGDLPACRADLGPPAPVV